MVKGVYHPVACRPQLETILVRVKNKPLKGWGSHNLTSCGGHLATVQRDGEQGRKPGRPHHMTQGRQWTKQRPSEHEEESDAEYILKSKTTEFPTIWIV